MREKLASLKGLILPVLLILAVLGSIFGGIATPTEAASVGVVGATIAAIMNRQFNLDILKKALTTTLRVNCMVMWIIIGARCFSLALVSSGGLEAMQTFFLEFSQGMSPNGMLFFMVLIVLVLGLFLEPVTIVVITIMIFMPVIRMLGFDPVWFGIIYGITIQIGFITPPFGFSLFYMKGVTPEGITLMDIYKAVVPFIILEMIGLAIIIFWPSTITWILN